MPLRDTFFPLAVIRNRGWAHNSRQCFALPTTFFEDNGEFAAIVPWLLPAPAKMSSIETVAIVANPIAGQGKGRATADRVCATLRRRGMNAIEIFDLTAESIAPLSSADAVVAIGGDGTLRTVARRCLAAGGPMPPLLPVPMGTANLMGRHLGIDWQAADLEDRIFQSLRRAQTAMFDAAQCNGELFLLMAGVGIDGQIVHELDRMRRGPINYASYALPAALAIASYRYPPIQVIADEEEIFPSRPRSRWSPTSANTAPASPWRAMRGRTMECWTFA